MITDEEKLKGKVIIDADKAVKILSSDEIKNRLYPIGSIYIGKNPLDYGEWVKKDEYIWERMN